VDERDTSDNPCSHYRVVPAVDVSFVRGEAVRFDTAAKAVTLAAGGRLAYDRLVVATGSRMRRPPVRGAEAAFSVDTQAEAIG
jgi:NADH dehydrogenase